MNKKILILFLIMSIVILIICNLFNETKISNNNPEKSIYFSLVKETLDNEFIFVASKGFANKKRGVVMKTNREGKPIWSRIYGKKLNTAVIESVKQIGDVFLLIGYKSPYYSNQFFKTFIICLNSQGEKEWVKTYNEEIAVKDATYNSSEEELILTGLTKNYIPFILKLDEKGNKKFFRVYEKNNIKKISKLSIVSDGIILFEKEDYTNEQGVDHFRSKHIFKLDFDLNEKWKIKYDKNINVRGLLTKSTDDIILAAYNKKNKRILINKISQKGELLWERYYNDLKNFNSMCPIKEKSLLIIVTENKDEELAMKIDENGKIVWKKNYKTKTNIKFVDQISKNKFILLTENELVKIDKNGKLIWKNSYNIDENIKFIKFTSNNQIILLTGRKILRIDSKGNKKWIKKYSYNDIKSYIISAEE